MTNAHYPPYPAYKPSGADWLGDIPAHWEVRRLKFVASQVTFKLDQKPSDKIYLGLESIESGTGRLLPDLLADTVESVVSAFQSGDVLFNKLRPYLAKVVHADFDGVCTSELMVLRPNCGLLHNRFLFYLMLSHGFISIVNAMTYGAKMPRASPSYIANLAICLPPLAEQRVIAEYLDRETAHVDALIAKKRELLDLLERQRTALISHAVTKGLNPAAPLKPSGVDWLGEIPAHWEVVPLKYRFDVRLGKMLQSQPLSYYDTKEPYLRAANILWGRVDLSDLKEMWFSPTEKEVYALKTGDLLVSEGGDVGRSAIWKGELENCFFQNAINRVRSRGEHSTKFLFYWLFFLKQAGYIDIICNKSTIAHYTAIKVANTVVALPPLNEEKSIVDYLDRETAQIDRLKGEVEASIDLLQRYRTALISAAVTGKIDVRAPAAASCPSA